MNFFKRPFHTLLYLTSDKIIRIDGDRKGVIKGEVETFEIACESTGSVPLAVEKFIERTPNILGRKVWLLYTRLNSTLVSLPSVQVEGVDNDVLEQALQFEYEALTGETVSKSLLSYQLINEADEMSNFWLNLVATETANRLSDVLKESGSSLAGLSHAGGLPCPFAMEEVASWLRLEYWGNAVFAISRNPETGLQLQIFNPAQNRHWQDEVNGWLAETGNVEASEALVTGRAMEMLPEIQHTYHLTSDEDRLLWLGLWLQQLIAQDATGIPLLNQKVNVNKELIYMVSSGMAALLLCGVHAGWMTYKTNDYTFQFEELNKQKTNLDSLKKTLSGNQDKIKKLKADIANLGGSVDVLPEAMAALKKRPARLLKILAVHSPDDLLIESIKPLDEHILVSGVTLQPELSNQLVSMIDEPLGKMGWQVSSPTKKSLDLFGKDNGPWAFEVTIKDLGLKGFIKKTAKN